MGISGDSEKKRRFIFGYDIEKGQVRQLGTTYNEIKTCLWNC